MDRAHVDYAWLYNLDSSRVFFVTRLKANSDIQILESYLTNPKQKHFLSDKNIQILVIYTSQNYPNKLRIVRLYDVENMQELILITNNISWKAGTISQLYKSLIQILPEFIS